MNEQPPTFGASNNENAMTTRQYFQARFDKAERDMCKARNAEERRAAYERRETARRQLSFND